MIKPLSILVLMNVLWAGTYTVVKFGLATMPPLSLVFWRMATAAFILWIWIFWRQIRWKIGGVDLIRVIGMGSVMAFSHILWVSGLKFTNASDAAILYAFEPIWSIFLVTLLLREKFHLGMAVGLIMAVAGLIVLSNISITTVDSLFLPSVALGNLLVVAGLFMESLYSVLAKPLCSRQSSAAVVALALLVASVIILAGTPFMEGGLTYPAGLTDFAVIFYLAVPCTVVGYALWVRIMRSLPVNVMLYTIFVQPVVGPFIAYIFLGESLEKRVLDGGIFILAGVFIAIYSYLKAHRQMKRSQESSAVLIFDEQ